MDPLDRLTKTVARTIGDGPDPRRRARQRRAVANLSFTPAFDRRWYWLVPLGLAAALALVWVRPQPAAPALVASANTSTPVAGAWFTASDQPLPVTFTDRSRVVLAPHAAATLATMRTDRVQLDLQRGQLDLVITPDPARAFTVTAGPFTVDVTGTAFTVDWQPHTTTLTVAVTDGRVHVHGGPLGETGTHLSAGQHLVTSPATATDAPPPNPAPAPPPRIKQPPPAPTWHTLAADGDHAAALAAAERAGFTDLLERLGPADLERLAHSARLAGAPGPASDALLTLRRRHPNDPRATTALFVLGRVALDLSHDEPAAAAWFALYLQTAPHGPLAADARARRMQILHTLGDVAGARAAATDYLQHHPDGSLADLARDLRARP